MSEKEYSMSVPDERSRDWTPEKRVYNKTSLNTTKNKSSSSLTPSIIKMTLIYFPSANVMHQKLIFHHLLAIALPTIF